MPFVKRIETEAGILGIWNMKETPEELISIFKFSDSEKEVFSNLNFDRRKKEFLSVRLLIEEILQTKPHIEYNQFGKPELINQKLHVSISHSAEIVTVIISDKNTGIDVEHTQRETSKIANRYLNNEEFQYISKSENPELGRITYWSAKEAIFKCTHHQGLHFNNQIIIHPFNFNTETCFKGSCITGNQIQHFKLWNYYFNNHIIVYCIEEKNILIFK